MTMENNSETAVDLFVNQTCTDGGEHEFYGKRACRKCSNRVPNYDSFGKCGCGKFNRYMVEGGMACNKLRRCLTYEELGALAAERYHEIERLKAELEISRAKETSGGYIDFVEAHYIRGDVHRAKVGKLTAEIESLREQLQTQQVKFEDGSSD